MFAAGLVKSKRKAAGYSAATFGHAIGVSPRHLRRYEAGDIEPPLSVAGLMARALGVSLDSLFVHAPEAATPANGRGETDGGPTAAAKRSRAAAHSGG